MNIVRIEDRWIAADKPTLVIAELGVNHDGSVQKAVELVRIAKACGADAVKLQVFRATALVHPSAQLAEYQREQHPADDPIDMLRRYELSGEELLRIVREIRELEMIPLATPFSPTDVDMIERLRLPAIKIASPDLVNRTLLDAVRQCGKPLLLSTGAATMAEVDMAVDWMRRWDSPFALLHCVSSYPTPAHAAHLCWIQELSRRFEVPVGYSDHTVSPMSGALAVAAGACIVERHLTQDRSARGPDHAASSDPAQFERYVRLIREAEVLRGQPGKTVLPIEQDVRKVSRQSLVLRRGLRAGEAIREQDLTVQRPGTGISPAELTRAIGRRALKPINAGAMLQWDMLEAA